MAGRTSSSDKLPLDMERTTPAQVTQLLRRWKTDGDDTAEDELFSLVQRELLQIAKRALGREPGFNHKIDPRELVSEAYLALREYPVITENRRPFFALMARAMRNVLMDLADHDRAAKRPPSQMRLAETDAVDQAGIRANVEPRDFYLALDSLSAIHPRQGTVLELRVLGFTNDEIAQDQGVSLATVKRDVQEGRAFMAFELGLPANWVRA
jgi:RNA polymerase sigma factor (TIGR02999 family)